MKKKILYFYGGPEFHPTEWAGNKMSEIFKADGRFTVDMTFDLDALTSLPESGYDAVALYMTGFKDGLTAEREKGLLKFVKNGGGFIGIHSAADTFRDSRAYVEMLNGKFLLHPAHYEFKLSAVDKSHYVTARMPDFSVFDEMCHLQNHDASKSKLLIECASESYAQPVFAWRSDKKISGGIMYNWGTHFIDHVLNLVDSKVSDITGELKKLVWNSVTNEDYGQVYIKFENGVTADFVHSNISAVPLPKWRILGTKGALETAGNEIKLVSYSSGVPA